MLRLFAFPRVLPYTRQTTRWYRLNHEAIAKLEQQAREIDARGPPTPKERGSDKALFFTALGLVLFTPPATWYWYQHRKAHMGKKKEDLMQQIEERRKTWIAESK